MVKKLTLSADETTVTRAKRLAAAQKTSVSALFDRFVRSIGDTANPHPSVGRLTQKATGIIKPRRNKTDRQLLEDALLQKYRL